MPRETAASIGRRRAFVMFKKPFANEVLVETLRRLIASTTKSGNAY
jgi:hypothetical protein